MQSFQGVALLRHPGKHETCRHHQAKEQQAFVNETGHPAPDGGMAE
jgi:hypothetical protein